MTGGTAGHGAGPGRQPARRERPGRPLPAGRREMPGRRPAACRCWSAWCGRWPPARGSAAILVSVDDEALLDRLPELAPLRASGRLQALPARPASAIPWPPPSRSRGRRLLVTTADHALLDPAMLDHFLAAADGVSRRHRRRRWPRPRSSRPPTPRRKRTYLRFRDGGYSGANLFLLRTARPQHGASSSGAGSSATARRPGGWPAPSGRYCSAPICCGVATLHQAMRLVSRRLGHRASPRLRCRWPRRRSTSTSRPTSIWSRTSWRAGRVPERAA